MTICGNTQCSEYGNCSLYFDCPLFKPISKSKMPKTNKYRAEKCKYKGLVFDSKKELKRYLELSILERAGQISELKRQVRFELIPAQKDMKGKIIERACLYIADFVYNDKNGDIVVEDTKGIRTKEYIIKRKLMLYMRGIKIKEI